MQKSAIYLLLLLLLASCGGAKSYRSAEGCVWNTTYHITYRADRDLRDSVTAVFRQVERSLSPFAEGSLISRINAGEDVAADSLIRRVFIASREVNRRSHGMFDPTVAPLINLWGFGYRQTGIEPTREAIDSMLAMVGIDSCRLDAGSRIVRKHPATEFNFSAITKGYGCDLVGEMLKRNGATDFMVEIGGEIVVAGRSPRGTDWRIMVDAPVDCDTAVVHEALTVISVTGCGIATSGNYRNYRETPDGKVWHTVSPVTGRPAVTDMLSGTVIAENAAVADAYATACMALGSRDAIGMIESLDGVEALLVTRDTVLVSSGFPPLE